MRTCFKNAILSDHPPSGRVARNERGGRRYGNRRKNPGVDTKTDEPSPAATASDPPGGRVLKHVLSRVAYWMQRIRRERSPAAVW